MAPPSGELDLNPTFGAVLIGLLISTFFLGINTSQAFQYFTDYLDDQIALKLSVAGTWILDFLQTVFLGHAMYSYLVRDFGNGFALLEATWSFIMEVIVTVFVTVIVQLYFANRIRHLGRMGSITSVIIFIFAVGAFACGITFAALSFKEKYFVKVHEFQGIVASHIACAVVCDLIITGAQVVFLHTSRTGVRKTEKLINRLLFLVVNQGLLTCLVVILELITFFTSPNTFVYILFQVLVSKTYTGSFFASLNARKQLRASTQNEQWLVQGSGMSVFNRIQTIRLDLVRRPSTRDPVQVLVKEEKNEPTPSRDEAPA